MIQHPGFGAAAGRDQSTEITVVLRPDTGQQIGLQGPAAPAAAGPALHITGQPPSAGPGPFQAALHVPAQRLGEAATRGQRANAHHIQLFKPGRAGFGAAQGDAQPLDLGAVQKTTAVVQEVVVGKPVADFTEVVTAPLAAGRRQHLRPVAGFRRRFIRQLRVLHRGQPVDQRQQREGTAGDVLGACRLAVNEAHVAVGGTRHHRLPPGRPRLKGVTLRHRRVRRQAPGQRLLLVVEPVTQSGQLHFLGGPVVALRHQAALIQRAHRIHRQLGETQLIQQPALRTRHLNQLEQAERAVLVKEVVVEVNILQLPEVVDHPIDLALVQLQGVLPDIPALHVRVLLDLLNIGHQVEAARIAARQPPVNIEQRVILLGGHGAEVDRPGQPHGAVVIALVQPQQGMTEHGGRAVQIGRGEHQDRALGVHRAAPLQILRAMGERLRFPPTE